MSYEERERLEKLESLEELKDDFEAILEIATQGMKAKTLIGLTANQELEILEDALKSLEEDSPSLIESIYKMDNDEKGKEERIKRLEEAKKILKEKIKSF